MEFRITDPVKIETFANIFQNAKNVCDQINIDFNEERLYIQTMDASKISILEITIASSWFSSYRCPVPVTIGMMVSLFVKILSARDKTQGLCIVYDHELASDTLHCDMTGEAPQGGVKTAFDRSFDLPLMEIDTESMSVPPITYAADFSMPAVSFSQLIHQLKQFGDSLDIQCNEHAIAMIAKTTEQGTMKVDIGIDDLSEFAIEEQCELELSFSLTQLHLISSFGKVAKEVTFHLHQEFPLRLDFLGQDGIKIQYYLAPRMQDE